MNIKVAAFTVNEKSSNTSTCSPGEMFGIQMCAFSSSYYICWTVFRSVTVGECSSGDIAILIILSRKNRKMVLELLLVRAIVDWYQTRK